MPPTTIFVAECDPLRGDGRTCHDRLVQAGTRSHLTEEPGLVHGCLRARHSVARACAGFGRIKAAIECLGQGLRPYG